MKSEYLTPLWLEDVDGDIWIHCATFIYRSELLNGIVKILIGTETDLASVPKPFRGIIPKSGKYNKAAVLHDAGYNGKLVTEHGHKINLIKPLCDKLFLEAMTLSNVDKSTREFMYQMVCIFGKKA